MPTSNIVEYLVRAAIDRALGVDAFREIVRVVLAPVPVEDVVKALTEGLVLPTFDPSTYVGRWDG